MGKLWKSVDGEWRKNGLVGAPFIGRPEDFREEESFGGSGVCGAGAVAGGEDVERVLRGRIPATDMHQPARQRANHFIQETLADRVQKEQSVFLQKFQAVDATDHRLDKIAAVGSE